MIQTIQRFQAACALLPRYWREAASTLSQEQKMLAEELRLRTGQPMTVLLPEGEYPIGGSSRAVTPQDLEELCGIITAYSPYAHTETIRRGYLMANGGYRVGLCGCMVMSGGVNTELREFSSAVIRIGRERPGIADALSAQLWPEGTFYNTLILSPPGFGKTTLLRDMVRLLSDGDRQLPAHRLALVDERGEVAGMVHGRAQLSVGGHTDVLCACPKALAIPILLRAVNPQVIAVDEITAQEDLRAMEQAANCGVGLLATIHAASRQELAEKPLFRSLSDMGVFQRLVTIQRWDGKRNYLVEVL